ncbi:unnamed protein product [Prorocentrum cordatum]|uniref:PARP catalytic domain-containing protein n=1 Tax=Prorocentrum cordatum TaxID=2364126 RepID=A0ABN9PVU3_9DINO|nr:unnamed protein product [Polarella glacialis]
MAGAADEALELAAGLANLTQVCSFTDWGSWSACACSEGAYGIAERSRRRSVVWEAPAGEECVDTDNGTALWGWVDCAFLSDNPSSCDWLVNYGDYAHVGYYVELCCACGGGTTRPAGGLCDQPAFVEEVQFCGAACSSATTGPDAVPASGCEWSEWGAWSACSTCLSCTSRGCGRFRNRHALHEALSGGSACSGEGDRRGDGALRGVPRRLGAGRPAGRGRLAPRRLPRAAPPALRAPAAAPELRAARAAGRGRPAREGHGGRRGRAARLLGQRRPPPEGTSTSSCSWTPGSTACSTRCCRRRSSPAARPPQDRPCPRGTCARTPLGCPCVQPGGDPGLPVAYRVRRVIRVESTRMWSRYLQRRAEIASARAQEWPCTFSPPLRSAACLGDHPEVFQPLDVSVNEAYGIHGTSARSALGIGREDFRIDLAGSGAGTMYGHGSDLAESSTKADEYSKDDASGTYRGIFAAVVSRVCMGKFRYTTERDKLAEYLFHAGEFDSTFGDREASVGTFRELVVYDTDQVYPEYILLYERVHAASASETPRNPHPLQTEIPVYWRHCHLDPLREPFFQLCSLRWRIRASSSCTSWPRALSWGRAGRCSGRGAWRTRRCGPGTLRTGLACWSVSAAARPFPAWPTSSGRVPRTSC